MAAQYLGPDKNFLAIDNEDLYDYSDAKVVIQSAPYELTSSLISGSAKGPEAILKASHYVEFYDEETDSEPYLKTGICTLKPYDFGERTNQSAVYFLYEKTLEVLNDKKFVVTFGAEHTVTMGMARAFHEVYPKVKFLQIDAHSDLRHTYHNNLYSHACVMARVNELKSDIVQVGIRAQCIEEAELMKKSKNISTFYAHQIHDNADWIEAVVNKLGSKDPVYITIDADGFDPSVMPAVGTPEPNGLSWKQGTDLLKAVAEHCNVVGFDIVEIAPRKGEIMTEFNCAKLAYKFLAYLTHFNKI
jgi:agmatinase